MTDKERLEEVVKNVVFLQCGLTGAPMGVELPEDDYWYLYEQAERVEELEEELVKYRNSFELQLLINNSIKNQIKRYREALEFYANKINYLTFIENGKSNIEHDQGEKARKALEG